MAWTSPPDSGGFARSRTCATSWQSLGHEPLVEPIPAFSARRAGAATGAFVVARAGDFPWLAVSAPAPERHARRLARHLASRGRVAGVLCLDDASRRLAIAVAVEGAPSLELDLDAPAAAALACLARLAGTGPGGALAYAARAADALSGEAVGRRFFREFKATLDRMADGLPTTLRGDDRRSLALLQLTRVLFLYFIQAKGWLAGRERFLGEEVDRCLARGRRLHRDLLRPLFFGTLNRAPADRGRCAAAFGAVPFLNGGLFEPHPLERRLRHDIPNAVWRDAFDRLFERFHFVVTERGAAGGIAPDMLGRVFEGVMAPDMRRASGTYYTPAALVRSILDAALTALAASRLGCGESEAERRLLDRDPAVAFRPGHRDAAGPGGRIRRLPGGCARPVVRAHGAAERADGRGPPPHPPAQPVRRGPERRGSAADRAPAVARRHRRRSRGAPRAGASRCRTSTAWYARATVCSSRRAARGCARPIRRWPTPCRRFDGGSWSPPARTSAS